MTTESDEILEYWNTGVRNGTIPLLPILCLT
jgi:hypothetical protein